MVLTTSTFVLFQKRHFVFFGTDVLQNSLNCFDLFLNFGMFSQKNLLFSTNFFLSVENAIFQAQEIERTRLFALVVHNFKVTNEFLVHQ